MEMLKIESISAHQLAQYATIPIAFTMLSRYDVRENELIEVPCPAIVKDYDAIGETPLDWSRSFDTRNWKYFLATDNDLPVGGATVAINTPGVHMLEGRSDLAALWDIRIATALRGQHIGTRLFEHVERCAREAGCVQLKIETQNTNVPACKFYRAMGCTIKEIRRDAYLDPRVADEVMIMWERTLWGRVGADAASRTSREKHYNWLRNL